MYEDAHFIAVNKPPGILVHRTRLSEDSVFVLQTLRDYVGYPLFPAHRLDRATSGVLIFGKNAEAAQQLGLLLMAKTVKKTYCAVVRGWLPEGPQIIDYPLADPETGKNEPLEALTHYHCIARSLIDAPIGLRYPQARFSLALIQPQTGRRHQIRKHFAHLRHPIIGDKRHGDVKHNTYFREVFGVSRMLLHARTLALSHPFTGEYLRIEAPCDTMFERGLAVAGLAWSSAIR